jgi:acyl transferase domain-containing protein/surfactin synthase thioesterase subunit/NADPH-dependent curcumin reductase CurA/NADP-dependent 3-hydroxy acid dehydrogenase YdfG/acyl carrier protein
MGQNYQYDDLHSTQKENLAIIGIGCRFPGGANSSEAFWKLLRDGVDAITEVPADRWNVDSFYDPDESKPGKMRTRWGGFVNKIDEFDAEFFGISPREASNIDPQQRLLLELAWEALEDGGQVPERLAGTKTGVFIGLMVQDYQDIQASSVGAHNLINAHTAVGSISMSIAANRISYVFDFHGPSITLDTACSSALVAVHLACQSIWNQESEIALAGGVNAILKPEYTIAESKASMLSPDGRCKSFDARANGYVRGEGAGIVVLKRLSQAQADGDPIYAVIRGSAVNQDGHTNGITVPNGQAQEAAIRQACKQAGILPEQIQYVEAHGTGTPVGDPIEANALGNVLGKNRPLEDSCIIGSVKTNIGHLESAAGVAGLIKAALVVKHGLIPPNVHFQTPNPKIPFEELRLRVPAALEPWPNGSALRIAGVNSFGFGGTNAHVVIAQAPESADSGSWPQSVSGINAESKIQNHKSVLLPLSARSSEALKALASAYKDFLTTEDSSLSEICYSASLRRGHHEHRLCVVGDSKQELAEHLEAFLVGETRLGMSGDRPLPGNSPKLVFVFSGMGQQWWAMGRTLLSEEPVFRETIQQCDKLLQHYTDWSLLKELTTSEETSRINSTQIAQCAIFSVQVALSALWRSWGIIPEAIVGHSVGEVAAAHVAGVLSLEDAVRVIFHRSRLQAKTAGLGKMLAVELSLESAQQVLAGYEERVSIAAINSPTGLTLAGETIALEEIAKSLERQQIFSKFLQVEVPYHSPLMEPLKAELTESLQGLAPQKAAISLFSTVTGQQVSGSEVDGGYWAENMRNPVLFATAVEGLLQAGHNLFLEIGAHPVLASYIRECSAKQSKTATVLPSLRRKEPELAIMLRSFGKLYTLGYPVEWYRLYPQGKFVRLPSYPWQRERYWNESLESLQSRMGQTYLGSMLGVPVHPLLGSRLESPQPQWKASLDKHRLTYLEDHRIQGAMVYPAAAYVEMALAAGKEIFGEGHYVLEDIEFQKALFLADEPVTVQLNVDRSSQTSFDIHSQPKGEESLWVRHAIGNLLGNNNGPVPKPVVLDEIRDRCTSEISKSALYQQLLEMGLEYGPTFQGIERLWFRDGEALAQLRVSDTLEKQVKDYQLYPALLDACFQVLIGTVSKLTTYLPVQIKRLRVYSRPGLQVWSHARLVEQNAKQIKGDIRLLDESGNVLVEIQGFCCKSLGKAQEGIGKQENYLYEYKWELKARSDRALVPQLEGSWLIFADSSGVGQQLAQVLKQREQTPILISPGTEFKRLDADFFQIRPEHPEDMQQLLEAVSSSQPALSGAIHLWSLDTTPVEQTTVASLENSQILGCVSVLHLVQALEQVGISPRLWLVTSGCFAVGDSVKSVEVAQSPLWGLGRVINNELPSLECTRVDISLAKHPEEIQALEAQLWSDDREDEIALRGEARYVHRLMRMSLEEMAREQKKPVPASSQPFRLEISQPGVLDNLILQSTARKKPDRGEVEIEVCAAGLNFKDVAKAMNMLADANLEGNFWQRFLGMECAGRISAIGSGVQGFEIGDEVIAFATNSFGTYTRTDARLVVRKPRSLSFDEAATIPLAFLTAYYALNYLGRINQGERVLIHAAAGGVGLAAVQLAQKAGAEIFATAGSPEKREFLKRLGVQHIMDSRSLCFADEVMELTNGKGVDIVLNSLAGEAIPKSLSVLGAYGRFMEIGKRDIDNNSKLGLRPFQNNLSLFAVDIDRLLVDRTDFAGSLFRELMKHFEEENLHPLPHRIFPISQAQEAFRYMAKALHVGKIVVSLQDLDVMVTPATSERVIFRPDGTYLIVGGLGGFSLAVAQWLVKNGAKHLVLMGRSGAASPAAQEAVKTLSEAGVKVVAAKADVAQADQVADVLAEIDRSMPPLRGIVHSAVVYDDAVLQQLDRERFFKVMAPKVLGAWNLHVLSLNAPLDFFINFSSISSTVGNPGQGNYVAANAFLDAVAHHRRTRGLPALTVNWGAIADVGYVAQTTEVGEHLERIGIKPLLSQQALSVLGELLLFEAVQTMVAPVNWQRWCQVHAAGASPRFSHLAGEEAISEEPGSPSNKGDSLRNALMTAEPAERQQLLELHLREQVARVLGTSAAKLDSSKPLTNLGLDSLMAVELSNRITSDLTVDVPTMKLMRGPSISQLAGELVEQLTGAASTAKAIAQTQSHSSVTPAATDWVVFCKRNPDARLRLFCFPYLGGSSSVFLPWPDDLPPDIEVCALQLPGYIDRLGEQPFDEITPLVHTLAQVLLPYLDKPFAFYGHSMGALLSFNLARHLRRENGKIPAQLFIGAWHAPQQQHPHSSVAELSDSELLKKISVLDLPKSVQQNPELMRLLLPSLKAGALMFEKYTYSASEPLPCPISVFGGMQDKLIPQEHLSAWREQTSSTFKLQMFPGNHLFLTGNRELLLQALSHELASLLCAPVK